jgi:hypothetical protein
MPSVVGHAIIGLALARAFRLNWRDTALATGLAVLPDADVLVGFVGKGDGEAWHRAQWSHSPYAALAVGTLAGRTKLVIEANRKNGEGYRKVLRTGSLASVMVASHVVMDRRLRNPLEPRKKVRFSEPRHLLGVIRYHVKNLPNDVVFYGSVGLTLYRIVRLLRV